MFATKAGFLVFVQIWLRWTLPRLRIDQVMTTCLKYLIPISCFLFLGAVAWPLVLRFGMDRTTVADPLGDRLAASVSAARVSSPYASGGLQSADPPVAEDSAAVPGEELSVEVGLSPQEVVR